MKNPEYVPVLSWGKDHWSTLAYAESCSVDYDGKLDNRRMRTNLRLHRQLAGIEPSGAPQDGSKYPTRLKSGEINDHDDWSCLEDAANAGFIEIETQQINSKPFGGDVARVKFTELGRSIVALLRKHKAAGGTFSNFTIASA